MLVKAVSILKYTTLALGFSGAVLTAANEAQAVTFDVTGGFAANLIAQTPGGNTDWFRATVTGTVDYDESLKQVTMNLLLNGELYEDATGTQQVGTISGSFAYFWNDINDVTLNGDRFQLAHTQGNGAGAIANITVAANGAQDDATFTLAAKEFRVNGTEAHYDYYNPVSDYLRGNLATTADDRGAFLIIGDLNGAEDALKSWFMSSIFTLNLGHGRTGNYLFAGDLHANAKPRGGTEVPEPASMALLGMGLLGGALRRKRQA